MAVLQHYYTSFVNRESGTAGFQVKAMSPGISADTQSRISRLIAYRVPPSLIEQSIARHPVALRYYYVGPKECILLCSQSNGTDENGRPGNFFAHTLVMEPAMFASVPPILYWRSSFWRTRDSGSSSSIAPLPSFEEDPSLDFEGIWSFLAQGNRIEQFYKLICAVVHHAETKRRIVIVDTADNVAMWIAAVSCMLPPDYRPLLSFATYHHDPYQSQFLITGTTSDSSFRASQEEYMSYFILNAETGRVSEVEDSPYAALVKRYAQSMDAYYAELLSLFADGMRRFPVTEEIGEQLDLMVLYFNVLQRQKLVPLQPEEMKSISVAVEGFERLRRYEEEDLQALSQLGTAVSALYRLQAQSAPALIDLYGRVVRLLKEHDLFSAIVVRDDLRFHAQLLAQGQDSGAQGIAELVQLHGLQSVTEAANMPDIMNEVNRLLRGQYRNPRALQLIWTYLGPYIQPTQRSQEFMLTSLETLGVMWRGQSQETPAVIQSMIQGMNGQEMEWLHRAAEGHERLSDPLYLRKFYYQMVSRLRLDQRVPYRSIVQGVDAEILLYELRADLKHSSTDQERFSCFERWIEHGRQQRMDIATLMDSGLKHLEKGYARIPDRWVTMASQILSSRVLGPLLPSDWEDRLVDTVLARISFSHYTPAEIALCEKYQNRAGLSAETRTVIAGLLAMSGGHLNQELASDLRDYFRNFSKQRQGAYQAEMKAFVSGFLPNCDSPESHRSLFTACCSGDFDEGEVFWLPYWEALKGELTNAFTARQALHLLSFWFGMKPEDLPEYILSYFFLDFPHVVEEVRKTRGFQDVVREMHERAAKQRLRWYPLLSDLFGGRKNILVSVGQSVGQGFKRLVAQGDEEAQQRAQIEAQKFEDSVAQLFEGKRLSDTQRQKFPTVYSFEQRERFWESYWEKFVKLVAHDAQQALDLLSFWFDESFTVWTQTPYAAESFFLGLQDALQVARKERGFQETARQINAKVRQRSSAYRWFPLIGDYFKVQESRIPWKR